MVTWRSLAILGFLMGCAALPGAQAAILINEVLADPPPVVGDANQDGVVHTTQDEFVELVNTGEESVSLAFWKLSDVLQVRHVFAGGTEIPGRGFLVIFGGGSPSGFDHAAIASTGGLSLNNSGDAVTLRSADDGLIASLIYGAEGGADVSLTRFPDAAGPFVKHSTVNGRAFSPGTTIDGTATLPPIRHGSTAPEPASLFLLGGGGAAMVLMRRRHRR